MSTPILPFATWASGTNQNSVPANDNSLRNQILNGNVISQVITAQPASPTAGDIYIIPASATGAQWATFTAKDLAIYSGGTWYAYAPVQGVTVNVSGVQYSYLSGAWAATSSGGAGGAVPNLLINGGFQVNQLQKSGTVTLAAGVYGHDGFKAGASGCTYTFAVSGGTTTLTITAGSLQQVVEGINLRTGTYALSWVGTAQGKVGAGSYGATGVTGSLTGGTNGTVEWNTGTLSNVCLIPGTVAQTYLDIGYAAEFIRCRRYCWRFSLTNSTGVPYAFMGTGAAFSTTQAYLSGYHPVPMYAVPTVVFEDSTAANYSAFNYVSGAHVPLTALVNPTGNVQTNEMWFLQATIGTTWASGAPVVFEKGVDITKSIRFEARL